MRECMSVREQGMQPLTERGRSSYRDTRTERQTQNLRKIDRQDRQTVRQTERQTDRQADRQAGRQADVCIQTTDKLCHM